jgi:uncharacterized protein YegJ (DUF2314 family)
MKKLFILVSALVFFVSCSAEQAESKLKTKDESVPAGSPFSENIYFQFAVYYLPKPAKDPYMVLRETLKKYPKLKLVNEMQEAPRQMIVSAFIEKDVKNKYTPPDERSIKFFGRGISKEQAEKLQKCEQVFILNFQHPAKYVWEGLKNANKITEAVALETGGVLWDEETREIFSRENWKKIRIESWTEKIPAISNHITMHAYKSDVFIRAITLGMRKFGLPDVVIENFPWSINQNMGNVINLFCQAMAEGAGFSESGDFNLDIKAIKNWKIRDSQIKKLGPGASGIGLLTLKKGTWEEGDPDNRLVELCFNRNPGNDIHAQQQKALATMFGGKDEVSQVKHSKAILTASKKAKEHLPELYKAFQKGLQPGEYILVKAPFQIPDSDGNEWMWVEISSWQGAKIKGLLKNEPYRIPSLHAGQIVEVKQEDIFDYIRRYPDGKEEGNKTGILIRQMQKKSENKQ